MPKVLKNPELEAAIVADPDGVAPYLAYAQWLKAQGDPRGDLALAHDPKLGDGKLSAAEKRILSAHGDDLLGELGHENEFSCTWRYGFLRTATIGGDEYGEINAAEALIALLELPAARFLRELSFGVPNSEEGTIEYAPIADALSAARIPETLRTLHIGAGSYQISWTELHELERAYPKLGKLEELSLMIGVMDLGKIVLPNLKSFVVVTGGLTKQNMASIIQATWPKLENLVLYFGDENYGCDVTVEDLAPIFEAKNLGHVNYLGLANATFADAIAKEIVHAPILAQLKVLDLSKGTLGDAGAAHLLEHADKLAHLEVLDVSESYLGGRVLSQLGEVCRKVVAHGQQTAREDARYVQVAE